MFFLNQNLVKKVFYVFQILVHSLHWHSCIAISALQSTLKHGCFLIKPALQIVTRKTGTKFHLIQEQIVKLVLLILSPQICCS